MTSIMTNSAALAALSTLRQIDSNMENTQSNISSGFRVEKASDNAAYWSIATTMRSDNGALGTVGDALGLAAAKVDTAYEGMNQSIELIKQIKNKLTAAMESSVDKDKVSKEIRELKNQLVTVAASSTFSSENWLNNMATTGTAATSGLGLRSMVGSFTRTDANTIAIQMIDFDTANSCLIDKANVQRGQLTKSIGVNQSNAGVTNTATYYLIGVTGGTGMNGTEIVISSTTSLENIDGMTKAVDKMLQSLTDVAATIGSVKARIDTQSAFVKNLTDNFTKGIGRLVDADMNEESTRLKALQTQQQLGIQALSIANNSSQALMQLFR